MQPCRHSKPDETTGAWSKTHGNWLLFRVEPSPSPLRIGILPATNLGFGQTRAANLKSAHNAIHHGAGRNLVFAKATAQALLQKAAQDYRVNNRHQNNR